MIKLKPASVGRPGGLEEPQANKTCPINQSPAVHPAGRTFDVYFPKAAPRHPKAKVLLGFVTSLGPSWGLSAHSGYSCLFGMQDIQGFGIDEDTAPSLLGLNAAALGCRLELLREAS